jgi:hypothetical protein
MKNKREPLCFLLFLLGVAFFFFQVIPSFLPEYFRIPLTWGDMLDFLTPFVIIPVFCLIFVRVSRMDVSPHNPFRLRGGLGKFLLVFGSLLYINGHGMHLSSNSVARLLQGSEGSELFRAVYLFDEIISHLLWHGGTFVISVGLIILAWGIPMKILSRGNLVLIIIGACFYGLSFAVNGIEGQTVILNFPAAGIGFFASLFLYLRQKEKEEQNALMIFFAAAYFMSIIIFAYWGIIRSGFPQFSELGWI